MGKRKQTESSYSIVHKEKNRNYLYFLHSSHSSFFLLFYHFYYFICHILLFNLSLFLHIYMFHCYYYFASRMEMYEKLSIRVSLFNVVLCAKYEMYTYKNQINNKKKKTISFIFHFGFRNEMVGFVCLNEWVCVYCTSMNV